VIKSLQVELCQHLPSPLGSRRRQADARREPERGTASAAVKVVCQGQVKYTGLEAEESAGRVCIDRVKTSPGEQSLFGFFLHIPSAL